MIGFRVIKADKTVINVIATKTSSAAKKFIPVAACENIVLMETDIN